MPENKISTKLRIFNSALRLFAANGVENVSMRNVADSVGIKAASIYNHYESKEQIVEACYDFFLKYHDSGRLDKKQYLPVLQHGTREEVANVLNNLFPEDMTENLVYAMIVLFARIYNDAKAMDIYTRMIRHSMKFLEEYFDAGIKIGRFGEFNIRGVSLVFISARLFAAQSITVQPGVVPDWSAAQKEMFAELVKIIPFRY